MNENGMKSKMLSKKYGSRKAVRERERESVCGAGKNCLNECVEVAE